MRNSLQLKHERLSIKREYNMRTKFKNSKIKTKKAYFKNQNLMIEVLKSLNVKIQLYCEEFQ